MSNAAAMLTTVEVWKLTSTSGSLPAFRLLKKGEFSKSFILV